MTYDNDPRTNDSGRMAKVTAVDPLAIVNLTDLAKRMGKTARTIQMWLAKDISDGTPGKHFPVPMSSLTGRVEWREIRILEWLEQRERDAL